MSICMSASRSHSFPLDMRLCRIRDVHFREDSSNSLCSGKSSTLGCLSTIDLPDERLSMVLSKRGWSYWGNGFCENLWGCLLDVESSTCTGSGLDNTHSILSKSITCCLSVRLEVLAPIRFTASYKSPSLRIIIQVVRVLPWTEQIPTRAIQRIAVNRDM